MAKGYIDVYGIYHDYNYGSIHDIKSNDVLNQHSTKVHQTKSGFPLASFEDVFEGEDEMSLPIYKDVDNKLYFTDILNFSLVTNGNMDYKYYDALHTIYNHKLGKALWYVGVCLMMMSKDDSYMTLSANNYMYTGEVDGWVKV